MHPTRATLRQSIPPLRQVVVGMDVASSEFLMPDGRYDLDFKNKGGTQQLTGQELGQLYQDLASKYPIVSIEDPFDQDDWAHYSPFTAAVGENVQVVGDDLLVTNPARIAEAGEKKACNALLLKVCVTWILAFKRIICVYLFCCVS